MRSAEDRKKVDTIWNLVKHEHAAVLVSLRKDGSLDSIPMGCVQSDFDGTLWFLTFRDNPRLHEIEENEHVLVSYVRASRYEFVSMSGRARIVGDGSKIRELWREGFSVWFPDGPDSPNIALIEIDVKTVKSWSKPASFLTYAYHYMKEADWKISVSRADRRRSPRTPLKAPSSRLPRLGQDGFRTISGRWVQDRIDPAKRDQGCGHRAIWQVHDPALSIFRPSAGCAQQGEHRS
jgi:general stress protein 26